jgi:hypothetical protein
LVSIMSNRLRASTRAGNKGRSLRPRPSPSRNSSLPPESDLGSDPKDGVVAPSGTAASPEVREARTTVPSPEVVAPAKITPAEVLAAGDAFSNEDEDEDEEVVPSAKVAAPVSVKDVEPPVVAKKAEEPKKAEPIAPAKKAEPIAAVKKVEPQVAAKKAEEPKKNDPPHSQSNNKKSEPVKAGGAKKVDENATTLRIERAPSVEEDSRSGNKKKGGKGESPKADAKRPASHDDVDDSSISAEFFRREADSLPPLVDAHGEHEDHDEAAAAHVLSPATIARRARLRRVVAGVVAFAGVITLAVVGKTLAASKQPATTMPVRPPVTQEAKVDPKLEEKAAPAPVKTVEAKPVEAPKASAEVAKVDPDPKADVKPVEEPKKADEPKKAEPSGGDVKALTREAESFLNRGNRKDAMVKAREAIAADPSQAMPYLLLGSALQDSGKWKDGIEAYSECVRNATKGPVSECRQMGGHK